MSRVIHLSSAIGKTFLLFWAADSIPCKCCECGGAFHVTVLALVLIENQRDMQRFRCFSRIFLECRDEVIAQACTTLCD